MGENTHYGIFSISFYLKERISTNNPPTMFNSNSKQQPPNDSLIRRNQSFTSGY